MDPEDVADLSDGIPGQMPWLESLGLVPFLKTVPLFFDGRPWCHA